MATANPIPDNTLAADNTTADLLVLVTAMAPEHFKGVLANLGVRILSRHLHRCDAERIACRCSREPAHRRNAAIKRSMVY